jgi:serine protease
MHETHFGSGHPLPFWLFCPHGSPIEASSGATMGSLSCLRKLSFAALLFASWAGATQAQQSLNPRVVPQKPTLEEMQAFRSLNRVIVKFREGSRIRLVDGQLRGMADPATFQKVLDEEGIPLSALRKMFTRPERDLDASREEGQRRSGRQLADANLYYIIDLPPDQSPAVIANRLNALDIIELAEPERAPVLPVDIPPNTPDYSSQQNYTGPAPTGINLPTPTQIPGQRWCRRSSDRCGKWLAA